jgi:hypothetical protein
VWWCTPAIPVTQEAEVGGSQSNTIPGTKVWDSAWKTY